MAEKYTTDKIITVRGQTLDEERALYGLKHVVLETCVFAGEKDGESALKECDVVEGTDCLFDLRYPLWHNDKVALNNCTMTENCRAALWYTRNIEIAHTKMHGIKALRECKNALIKESDIISPEFGWKTDGIRIFDSKASGEYCMLLAKNIEARRLEFKGKYSFQYVENVTISDSRLDTKDAFWHGKNILVENCIVTGEYLAWFAEDITFRNCTIIGTQPFCYCNNLRLENCIMQRTDLAFERSSVRAVIVGDVDSIKNPYSGSIRAGGVGEVIRDDDNAVCEIIIDKTLKRE